MNLGIAFSRKLSLAYQAACRPLCQALGMAQSAFDIMMFLGNNPEYRTARDIVAYRGIKASIVSIHVEQLVQEGYLRREAVAGDRRKVQLLCTDRALPVIRQGQIVQQEFFERMFSGADETLRQAFFQVLALAEKNLDELLEA